jgi:two-component system nitrogen regulation response regulator GlnG
VKQQLLSGKSDVAKQAIPRMEALLIETALAHTHGRKHEAAILLGYGRNTLTRKLKELNIAD